MRYVSSMMSTPALIFESQIIAMETHGHALIQKMTPISFCFLCMAVNMVLPEKHPPILNVSISNQAEA